jgi:hypothetical protein
VTQDTKWPGSRQELADRYGLPINTIAQWASKGSGPRYARMGRTSETVSAIIEWEEERLDDDLRAAQPGVPTKHVVDQTVTCNVLLGPAVLHVRVSRACRQQGVGCPAGALI